MGLKNSTKIKFLLSVFDSKRFSLGFLIVLFLIANGALFQKLGIMTDDDTVHYLAYAEGIKENGIYFQAHYFWYIGYALFILLANSILPGLSGIVIFQYLFSLVALICLYYASLLLFHQTKAALITCLCFLGFFMIQFWNLFVYAESLQISLYCISFFLLMRVYRRKSSRYELVLTALVILWAVMARPNGIALLAGLLSVGMLAIWKSTWSSVYKWGLSSLAMMGLLLLANQMLSTYGIVESYQNGELIYNIHKVADQPYAASLMYAAPENLWTPKEDTAPLLKVILMVWHNPVYASKLFAAKVFLFLGYVRPYYSVLHNVLALLLLIPMYFAFTWVILKGNLETYPKVFAIAFVACAILNVALLSDNWNSRFLMPVLPMVFLVGGGGIGSVIRITYEKNLRHFGILS